jgi:uncharacterized protein YecE (DUF72 family)
MPLPAKMRFGTSSFSEKDWVGPFYPPGTPSGMYLQYYSQQLDTVEIDATYYAIPSAKTVASWVEKTPDHFTFAVKFPRSIVHAGDDAQPDCTRILQPDAVYPIRDQFLQTMSILGKRLGPLVLQFPYFARDVFSEANIFNSRLDRFLSDLPREFRYGVEIRNKSWLKPELTEICRRHRVAIVLTDFMYMPLAGEYEKYINPRITDFQYVRLIGNRKEIEAITLKWDKEIIDQSSRLDKWADFIIRLENSADNIYVYVNNHYAGYAPSTVRRLQERIREKISI